MPTAPTTLEAASMNEETIQFIMKAFAIVICAVLGMGMLTLCFIIIRDGSTPLVAAALDDIKVIAIGGFGSVVAMVTGRSIVSNTYQRMMGQNTTTTSVTSLPNGQTTSTTIATPATVSVATSATGGDGSATSGGTGAQG